MAKSLTLDAREEGACSIVRIKAGKAQKLACTEPNLFSGLSCVQWVECLPCRRKGATFGFVVIWKILDYLLCASHFMAPGDVTVDKRAKGTFSPDGDTGVGFDKGLGRGPLWWGLGSKRVTLELSPENKEPRWGWQWLESKRNGWWARAGS